MLPPDDWTSGNDFRSSQRATADSFVRYSPIRNYLGLATGEQRAATYCKKPKHRPCPGRGQHRRLPSERAKAIPRKQGVDQNGVSPANMKSGEFRRRCLPAVQLGERPGGGRGWASMTPKPKRPARTTEQIASFVQRQTHSVHCVQVSYRGLIGSMRKPHEHPTPRRQ